MSSQSLEGTVRLPWSGFHSFVHLSRTSTTLWLEYKKLIIVSFVSWLYYTHLNYVQNANEISWRIKCCSNFPRKLKANTWPRYFKASRDYLRVCHSFLYNWGEFPMSDLSIPGGLTKVFFPKIYHAKSSTLFHSLFPPKDCGLIAEQNWRIPSKGELKMFYMPVCILNTP